MKITKHAQSCFLVETENAKILIDAGTFVFNEEGSEPDNFSNIDLLIFTHEHSDHFDWDNVQKIIDGTRPTVLGTAAVTEIIKQKYPDLDIQIISAGYIRQFDGFSVEGFASEHGPLPNGNPAPEVSGVVINDGKNRFYTPGDSIHLDEKSNANIIATPICGQVVMNIDQAKEELLKLKPEIAIPIHYDSPNYPVDVNDFVTAMADTDIKVKVLKWGESINIQG